MHSNPDWSSGPAAPTFPGRRHSPAKWAVALRPAEAVVQCLADVALVAGDDICEAAPSVARQQQHVWGIEAATALATTAAGLVRDIWLGSGAQSPHNAVSCLNLAEAVLNDLTEESKCFVEQVSRATNKGALLNSCLKLLRDPGPAPLPCLMMGCSILTELESNREWGAMHMGVTVRHGLPRSHSNKV